MNFVMNIYRYGRLFQSLTGPVLYVLFVLIALGGVVEAMGISMLLPLLSAGTGVPSSDPLTQRILSLFDASGIAPSLGVLLAVMVALFVTKGVLTFSHRLLATWIQTVIRRRLQVRLSQLFGDVNYSYYAGLTSGKMNNLIVREVPRFLQGFMEFTRMPVSVAYTVAYVAMAATLRLDLTLIFFSAGLVTVFLMRSLIGKTRDLSMKVTESAGGLQDILIEYMQNLPYLKATAGTKRFVDYLQKKIHTFAGQEFKLFTINAFLRSIREPVAVLTLAVLIFHQVSVRGETLNEVIILGLILYRLIGQTMQLQSEWQRFNGCIGGVLTVKDTLEVLDQQSEPNGHKTINRFEGQIEFSDVSAHYGDAPVLSGISMTVRPHETIGIVGPSGSGKTTFFNLLTGLMSPIQGRITIDGTDYADVKMESLRGHFGYVTQNPVIFNDSIANNISFWQCDAQAPECLEKIQNALELANAADITDDLGAYIGERGVKLSGGQRQRIAIARELFKEPDVLIFDEATSSLDSNAELAIQESISKMKGQRTIILIAHRLSTVLNCDRIFVFSEGRIIEEGPPDVLYRQEGSAFFDMCQKQNITL